MSVSSPMPLDKLRLSACEGAPMIVMIADSEGKLLWCNDYCEDAVDYRASDLVDKDGRVLRRGVHNEAFYDDLWRVVNQGQTWTGRMVNRQSDGVLHCELVTVKPLAEDGDGSPHFAVYRRRISDAVEAERREHRLQGRLSRALVRVRDTLRGGVEVLADLADHQTRTFGKHATRVSQLSVAIAQTMGWDRDQTELLRFGAQLHDIGKIVEDRYLSHASSSLDRRYLHAPLGCKLLRPIPDIQPVCEIVRHHHEAFGGGGYPDGLAGSAIPAGARIVTAANYFDRLRSSKARPHKEILAVMRPMAGETLDPEVLEALEQSVQRQLSGHLLVSLRDLRPGMRLARDVRTTSGTLLCKAETEVTPRLIDRLSRIFGQDPIRDRLTIHQDQGHSD